MAAQKKLQKGSVWEKYDLDGDGVKTNDITPEADPDAEGVWEVDGNGDLIPLDV